MCRMTDTGFRWDRSIYVSDYPRRWYVYEREPGEQRYSTQHEEGFKPLYSIVVKPRMPHWYRNRVYP